MYDTAQKAFYFATRVGNIYHLRQLWHFSCRIAGYSMVPEGRTTPSIFSTLVKHCQDIIDQAQSDGAAMVDLKISHQLLGAKSMSKEQKSNKADKKKPTMIPKEKKAVKKSKKESKDLLVYDKTR